MKHNAGCCQTSEGTVGPAQTSVESVPSMFSWRRCRTDLAVVVVFLGLSLAIYFARGGFAPRVVNLTSDAANIASFAAASDHPRLFARDSSLFNPSGQRFYVAFHVPATRLLARLTGDYGLAFTILLLPTMFLYLVGFYFLGLSLFGHRGVAVLLTLANLILVKGPRDTAWGPFKDALPRFDHAIVFALLIALLWRLRDRPWWWCLILFCAGLGLYVHPVSTPALAAMLIGGGVGVGLYNRNLRRCIGPILVGVLLFAVAIAPFAVSFTASAVRATDRILRSADDAIELTNIVEERFTGWYLSPSRTIAEYFSRPHMAFGIIPLFVIGTVAIRLAGGERAHGVLALSLGATAGLVFATIVVPVAIEFLTPPLSAAVFKGELPRPLRYLVPLTYMVALAAAYDIWTRAPQRWGPRLIFVGVIIALVAGTAVAPRALRTLRAALTRNNETVALLALLDAIQAHCSPDYPILAAMEDPLVIRYSALRPLAYARKDVPPLDSLAGWRRWKRNAERLHKIQHMRNAGEKVTSAAAWARELGARFVVVELDSKPTRAGAWEVPEGTSLLFQNSLFVLLEVRASPTVESNADAMARPSPRITENDFSSGEMFTKRTVTGSISAARRPTVHATARKVEVIWATSSGLRTASRTTTAGIPAVASSTM